MYKTDALKNVEVDAADAVMAYMSLHTAFSTTGANEVTGGSYARQATGRDAASGGEATLTANESFPVPAGDVAFIGWWSASTAGTFYGMTPNYGSANPPAIFFAEGSTDVIKSDAHGLSDTNTIVFFGGSLSSGLTQGTIYYVRDSTTDTFKVATTSGGTAVTLSTDGRGVWMRIAVETFASAGTFNVTAAPMNLNLITT